MRANNRLVFGCSGGSSMLFSGKTLCGNAFFKEFYGMKPPIKKLFPELYADIEKAVDNQRPELLDQLQNLCVYDTCDCSDELCGIFYARMKNDIEPVNEDKI